MRKFIFDLENTGLKTSEIFVFLPGRFVPYNQSALEFCLSYDDTVNFYSM